MAGAIARLKKIVGADADPVAAIEAEIAELRGAIAERKDEAARLGSEWLYAPSQAEAERCDAARREALRTVERDEFRLPELDARLTAARAARSAAALTRHRNGIEAISRRLRRALAAAAEINGEIIAARQAAVAELGEAVVGVNIPQAVYGGLLLPDLVQSFAQDQERI